MIRPEIFEFLIQSDNAFVDDMYKQSSQQQGFVLWFTGLSQAGKTTQASRVYQLLKEQGVKVEYLDGDVLRQHISKDLGFSRENRDENIRRVAFVAKLLSNNGVGVVCSFISPYEAQRALVREQTLNFIEVFCDCPLEICEQRDTKGMYSKARTGEIPNFTGISDPYEVPQNPEIHLNTANCSVEGNAEQVLLYLTKQKLVV